MQKPFNAINGLEALEMLVADVRRQLSMDGRFRQNLTYHQLSYSFRVNINTFPVDAGTFTEVVEGVVGPRQPVGFPHLGVPVAPLAGETQAHGHTYQAPVAAAVESVPASTDRELSDDDVLRLAQQRGLVPSNAAGSGDAGLLGRGPSPRSASVDPSPVVEIDERLNPKTLSEAPRASGGAGEVITGGAREPDGRVLSIGAEHRRAFDEGQKLERVRSNDDAVAAGGQVEGARVVENPNAARRDVGLSVPTPTRVGGSVVDVPTVAGDAADGGPSF